MGIIDEAALDRRIREIAREEAVRPSLVHQRNVEQVVGLPRRDFLRLARADAFPSTRERRLVVARSMDVLAYFEQRFSARRGHAPPASPDDPEAAAFARVGARRVAASEVPSRMEAKGWRRISPAGSPSGDVGRARQAETAWARTTRTYHL